MCGKYEYDHADSVIKYANLQLDLALQNNLPAHKVRAYTNLGVAYTHLYKFNEALINYLKARQTAELSKCCGVAPILGQIGYIYLRLGRNKEAYKYFKLQEIKSQEEKNDNSYLSCVVNLSDYYTTLGDIDSSFYYLKNGLQVSRKINNREKEGIILDNIANYYFSKGVETDHNSYYKTVQQYADTALSFHLEDQDSAGVYFIYGLLGAVHTKLKNYQKAETYYQKYINYSERTQDIYGLRQGVDEASLLYAEEGKFEKAFQLRLRYDSLSKKYLDEEANQQVAELNKKYDTEKKEQQNRLLKKENEKQKVISYFIIAGLVLSLLLAFFIYRGHYQKKKANLFILRKKEEVEKQKLEISHQKEMIEEKQKEILDSIHYANRIQKAVITPNQFLSHFLKEYFIFFKPKDIVSGDFYWATENHGYHYLAVCDSTGHGVPGAFMSLLNIAYLSEAINEKNISKPHEIFNYVRQRLVNSISIEGQKDGFDGIMISIDYEKNKFFYSAAHNAPLLIRQGQLTELPYDKMPVGKGERENSFKTYEIDFQSGDILYLYTDGYADQFGGEKGKKYKYKQLNQLLIDNSTKPLKAQKEKLEKEFITWQGNLEQVDDVLIVGIRF